MWNRTGFQTNVLDADGNPIGGAFLDDRGFGLSDNEGNVFWRVTTEKSIHNVPEEFKDIRVVDENGNILWQVTTEKSVHNIPEEYALTDGSGNQVGTLLIGPGGLTVTDNAGTIAFKVDQNGVVIGGAGGGPFSIPLLGGGTLAGDGFGLYITDANGNTLWQVNTQRSVHNIPEDFRSINIVDSDGNVTGTWNDALLLVSDKDGSNATVITPGGVGTFLQDEAGNLVGEAAISSSGFELTDKDGNVLWRVGPEGSLHNISEAYSLTDESGNDIGDLVIGLGGITVLDNNDNIVFRVTDKGVVVGGGSAFPISLAGGGTLTADASGIAIKDANGNVVWQVNAEKSLHKVPEEFTDIRIVDSEGNKLGFLAADGLFFIDEEGFAAGISSETVGITLVNAAGEIVGEADITRDGFQVFDKDGNVVWQVNTEKSVHNIPEEFALFDSQGNPTGKVVIDSVGIAISDAGNNLVSLFNQDGSIHNKNEEWRIRDDSGNIVGRLVLGPDGLTVTDSSGNVVFQLNEKGVVTGKGCSPFGANLGFFGAISCIEDSQGNIIGAAGLTPEGFQVVDANDNLVWQVNTQKSIHNIPEEFKDIRVVDEDGNVVWQVTPEESVHKVPEEFTDIRVVDNEGNIVWQVTPEKSVHNIPEEYVLSDAAGNKTGTLVIGEDGSVVFKNASGKTTSVWNETSFRTVLRDAGGNEIGLAFLDDQGLALVDSLGLPLWSVTTEKSVHNIPEEYRLTDAAGNSVGTLTIGQGGLTVKNNAGTTVFQVNENGVVVGGGSGGGTASALSVTLPGGETLTVDSNGINLMAGVHPLYQLTPQGSFHRVPEVFTSIKVETDPNSTAPKTTIDISPTTGITMFDEQTGAVSGVNPSGQFFSSTSAGSYFAAPGTGIKLTNSSDGGATFNSVSIDPSAGGIEQITNSGNTVARIDTGGTFSTCDNFTDTCTDVSSRGVTTPSVIAEDIWSSWTNSVIVERFPVVTGFSYTPGTVLVIDASTGRVKPSTSAADPAVIGVVAPGGTVDANGEVPVVILGARGPMRMDGTRVEVIVNVDTSLTGPIVPGDPLVTSPAQGRAMKRSSTSTDPAAIFAKALQPMPGGQQGQIRAFINP